MPGRSEPFDCYNLIAVMRSSEGQTTIVTAAVDVNGAGAALAVIASHLGAGEMQHFAQAIEQGQARIDGELMLLRVTFCRLS